MQRRRVSSLVADPRVAGPSATSQRTRKVVNELDSNLLTGEEIVFETSKHWLALDPRLAGRDPVDPGGRRASLAVTERGRDPRLDRRAVRSRRAPACCSSRSPDPLQHRGVPVRPLRRHEHARAPIRGDHPAPLVRDPALHADRRAAYRAGAWAGMLGFGDLQILTASGVGRCRRFRHGQGSARSADRHPGAEVGRSAWGRCADTSSGSGGNGRRARPAESAPLSTGLQRRPGRAADDVAKALAALPTCTRQGLVTDGRIRGQATGDPGPDRVGPGSRQAPGGLGQSGGSPPASRRRSRPPR